MLSLVAPCKILFPDVFYFLPQSPVLHCQPLHTLNVPFQLAILLGHTFLVNENPHNSCFYFLKSFCVLQPLFTALCSVLMAEVDTGGGDSSEGVSSPLGPITPSLLPPTDSHLGHAPVL